MSYDPVESLRAEIERFERTNTFSALSVTNLFVQARVVLEELERLRFRNKESEQALMGYEKLCVHYESKADTAERQVRALRERCDQLEIQTDELIDQIERTLHLFGSDTEGRAQAEGAIAFARKVRSILTPEAEQQEKGLDLSGAVRVMSRMADSLDKQQDAQPCGNCHEGTTDYGFRCKSCNGTGKAQQGEGDK